MEPAMAEASSGTLVEAAPAPDEAPSTSQSASKPTVMIVIGMAGSGKTTLIQRINSHLHTNSIPGYIINLDPAVMHLPYAANIDIRDTVKYKKVMQQYGLGPNGGILTSCNLFATRFDQVVQLCEKPRTPPLQHIVVDTPGQIEIFTWSASGQIVTELLASSFPTVVAYVVDTPRCASPQTFMSNMLQAVSILYKTRLPLLLVFNKVDVQRHEFAEQWMDDFETYLADLEASDASYAATLSRSLALVLEEFYGGIVRCGVSALTGEGIEGLFQGLQTCAQQYNEQYLPEMEAQRQRREAARQAEDMRRLRADVASMTVGGAPAAPAAAGSAPPPGVADAGRPSAREQSGEEESEEGEEGEGSADLVLSDESIEPDEWVRGRRGEGGEQE